MAFMLASQAQHQEATEMDEAELAKMDEMDFAGVEELAEDTPNFEKAAFGEFTAVKMFLRKSSISQ